MFDQAGEMNGQHLAIEKSGRNHQATITEHERMSIAELRAKLGKSGVEPTTRREKEESPPKRPRIIWPPRVLMGGLGPLGAAMA